MSHNCPSCSSDSLYKRGKRWNSSETVESQQYSCNDCGNRFSVELMTKITAPVIQGEKYVFTYYQPGTEVNNEFLETLGTYSEHNDAKLVVLSKINDNYPIPLEFDVQTSNSEIGEEIVVYAQLNITPTAENPLAGLDTLSKGKTLIVGHNTLQMKMIPVFGDKHPIMLTTTGTISVPAFDTSKKAGAKANHNHSYSAIVLEMDAENDIFHVRVLNAEDDGSFYDLDTHYKGTKVTSGHRAEALILGDVHVTVVDQAVHAATFEDVDSIVETMKPKTIVYHDLLDFGLMQSHHNAKSFIKRYEKFVSGKDSVSEELNQTLDYIVDNTPSFVEENLIISSNHNDHLTVYLDSVDSRYDYKNSKLYHYLMYRVIGAIEMGREVNPFQFFFEDHCTDKVVKKKTKFLGREDVRYICDILISSHGDRGSGGSRFSPTQGKKYPSKMIVGHSHSPSINGGLYVTGTMTGKLDYTSGTPSGWLNTHCIIQPNGKRQLVSVIKGKWRL